jgi:hypothetical protein
MISRSNVSVSIILCNKICGRHKIKDENFVMREVRQRKMVDKYESLMMISTHFSTN